MNDRLALLTMSDEERHKAACAGRPPDLSQLTAIELRTLLLSAHQGRRFNCHPSVAEIADELVRRLSPQITITQPTDAQREKPDYFKQAADVRLRHELPPTTINKPRGGA